MKTASPVYILILSACLASCFFIGGCENSYKEITELTSKRIGVEQAKDVVINYSISGKTKSRLKAPLMLRYQDTAAYLEFPNTIHADFYNDSLAIESKLDSRYAKYLESENKIFLKDSVRVTNTTGDTLYCNEYIGIDQKEGRSFTLINQYV